LLNPLCTAFSCSPLSFPFKPLPLPLAADKLNAIKPAMEQAVAKHQAAGIVTLVMQNGKILHHEAVGMADVAKGRAMKEHCFRIASMTKSINATAVMTLVDAGKASLDEPASKWLPELGKATLVGGAAPSRPVTLRDLLSHTAGITFPKRAPTDGAVSLKNYAASSLRLRSPLNPAPVCSIVGRYIQVSAVGTQAGTVYGRVGVRRTDDAATDATSLADFDAGSVAHDDYDAGPRREPQKLPLMPVFIVAFTVRSRLCGAAQLTSGFATHGAVAVGLTSSR